VGTTVLEGIVDVVGAAEPEGSAVLEGAEVADGTAVIEGIALGVCDGVKVDCTVGKNEGCSVNVGTAVGPTGCDVGFNVEEGVVVGLVG